jgi:hypothetical protein
MTMTNKVQFSQQVRDKEERLATQRVDSMVARFRDMNIRQDALQFSKNQLEALSASVLDVLYSNPRDAFKFMPLNTEVPDGATEWSYRQIQDLGAAAIVADGATDRPLVDQDLTKTTFDVFEMGSGYTFTVGDQARSGAILEFPYVQQKARLAATTIALAHNQFAMLGGGGVTNGPAAVTGFLTNATVITNKPTPVDADWSSSGVTGDGAYNTISQGIVEVSSGSDGVHAATDAVLSTTIYNTVSSLLMGDGSAWGSSQTVLSALRQNHPEITFHRSESCTGQGTGGIDRNVLYERGSDNAEYVASVVYDESQAINAGFRWTVHSRGRAVGCVIKRPLAMVYLDITV